MSPNEKLNGLAESDSNASRPPPGALCQRLSLGSSVDGEGEGSRSSWSASLSSAPGVTCRRVSGGARPRTSRWLSSTRHQSMSASTRRFAVSEPDDRRGLRGAARVWLELELEFEEEG